MKNKHIERIERRRNNVEKKLKVREKRLKGPPISIGPGDLLNVEKLMAKVDEADKYGGVVRVKNVIIMIRTVFLTFEREKANDFDNNVKRT